MKQLAVLFCLACLLLFTNGCEKDKSALPGSMEGVWELRQAKGMATINYPPGNGNTIKFSGDHYEMSANGQVVKSGTFTIIPDATVSASTCIEINNGWYSNRIVYDNDMTGSKVFIEVSLNKLNFISGCFALDAGAVTEYVRQ
ncbi:MAG: hypothetical protein WDO16_20655 [Bacteroidota bacterium]